MADDQVFNTLLNKLERFSLDGIPKRDGEIHPHYGGYSIANLPASMLDWLGVPAPVNNPLAGEIQSALKQKYRHIIFLLVDGLKLALFQRFYTETRERTLYQAWARIFEHGLLAPLTSIAPSTTSAALTTLWTGRLPVEHGIIGYELFLKEFGLTANMIFHSVASFQNDTGSLYRAGFDPETFLPVPTLGPLLQQNGVKPFAFQHSSISSSGLSRMLLKGVESIPFESAEDLWSSVRLVQEDYQSSKTYSYIYWGGLDTFSHHNGPDSTQLYDMWLDFARSLAGFLNPLIAHGRNDTLFVLTADHGQIATEIKYDFDLHHHPELARHLALMPTGESRLPYLFIMNGHEVEVENYLNSHWNGKFAMLPSSKVLSNGLLGTAAPHPSTLDRVGSHIVFPENNAYWWWVNKENHLLGRHGGLSRDEMLVPFFAMEV